MGRLDGKVALISGAARGQGEVEAKLFAREGARVVLGDVLDREGQQVEASIAELGGEASYIHLDVTQEQDWQSAIEHTLAAYGKLDILVNNAAILSPQGIEATEASEWDNVLAVNARGVFLGTKHAIPAMRAAGGGSIINISSIAGIVGSPYGMAAYSASKGAVRVFSKLTAVQQAKDKIRCNSVHPGPIDTEMLHTALGNANLQERLSRAPLGRVGTCDDVAYGVLYLASDESSYVTGTELVIDGGCTAQ